MYSLVYAKRGKEQIPYWVLKGVELTSTKSIYPMGCPKKKNIKEMFKQLKAMEKDLYFPPTHRSHHSIHDPTVENWTLGFHDNATIVENKYGHCLIADLWFFSFPFSLVTGEIRSRSMEGLSTTSQDDEEETWYYKSLALLSSKAPNCVFPAFGPDTIQLSAEARDYFQDHKESLQCKSNVLQISNPKRELVYLSLQEGAGMDKIKIKEINLSSDEKKVDDETAALAAEVEALQEKLDQKSNMSKTKEILQKQKEKLEQKLAEQEGDKDSEDDDDSDDDSEDDSEDDSSKEKSDKKEPPVKKDDKDDKEGKKDMTKKKEPEKGKTLQLAKDVIEIKKSLGEASSSSEEFILSLLEKGFSAKEIIRNIKTEINWEKSGKEVNPEIAEGKNEFGEHWEKIQKSLNPKILEQMNDEDKKRLCNFVPKQSKLYEDNPELLQDTRRS